MHLRHVSRFSNRKAGLCCYYSVTMPCNINTVHVYRYDNKWPICVSFCMVKYNCDFIIDLHFRRDLFRCMYMHHLGYFLWSSYQANYVHYMLIYSDWSLRWNIVCIMYTIWLYIQIDHSNTKSTIIWLYIQDILLSLYRVLYLNWAFFCYYYASKRY